MQRGQVTVINPCECLGRVTGCFPDCPVKKVLFQAGLKGIFAFTLFFVCCVGVAEALELTVSPTGSNNDQTIINNALEAVHNSGGGKVYLNAGTYKVDNTVFGQIPY